MRRKNDTLDMKEWSSNKSVWSTYQICTSISLNLTIWILEAFEIQMENSVSSENYHLMLNPANTASTNNNNTNIDTTIDDKCTNQSSFSNHGSFLKFYIRTETVPDNSRFHNGFEWYFESIEQLTLHTAELNKRLSVSLKTTKGCWPNGSKAWEAVPH